MERFTSYEIISSVLVWLGTSGLRLAGEVVHRKDKAPAKLSFWRVLFHFASTATVAFLASTWLHEKDWSNSVKMGALFLATFLAPVIIDALMLVSGKMLLAEFAKWLASKTGTPPDVPEDSSPENPLPNDTPENSE